MSKQNNSTENDQIKNSPVNSIEWIHRDELTANDYNPNSVAAPELQLLKHSILADGWTQPIVINPDMEIVDGYHRWTVSGEKELLERDGGLVPVAMISPVSREDQKMSTVRHNRARGSHSIVKMSEILEGMVDRGLEMKEIMRGLGMESEEVLRLAMRAGIPRSKLISDAEWSTAWTPGKD